MAVKTLKELVYNYLWFQEFGVRWQELAALKELKEWMTTNGYQSPSRPLRNCSPMEESTDTQYGE